MECVKDSIFNYKFSYESDEIDIKDYFENYATLLMPFEPCPNDSCSSRGLHCNASDCKNDQFYMEFLNVTIEQLRELQERTDVNRLTCVGEVEPVSHEFHTKFQEENLKQKSKEEAEVPATSLTSVRRRTELLGVPYAEFSRENLKYCNYQWYPNNEKSVKNKLEFQPVASNVVACVKVYRPFLSSRSKSVKLKLLQEIHVLGDQTLSQLKDKIICSLDYIGDKDLSTEFFLKDVGLNITAKDEFPSSFIFIENTFYNDTRSSELVDLSKVIREWASGRGLGSFDCKSMENTKICDLKLKMGRPYVYQHQGNCEHLIVFSDIRFIELSDPSKSTSYPRLHCTGRIYGKHCMMCSDSYARWIVVGNERLTHDKTYLCKKCFVSYNYINGQKIGEFEAYKYVDPVALL